MRCCIWENTCSFPKVTDTGSCISTRSRQRSCICNDYHTGCYTSCSRSPYIFLNPFETVAK